MTNETKPEIRGLLECGRIIIADWTTEYRIFVGATPVDAQEADSVPLGVFQHSEQSLNILKLVAAMIMRLDEQGFKEIPDVLAGEVKTADELAGEITEGNPGSLPDDLNIRILGSDGHPINS
jgi:hypothetical protein